MKDRILTSSEQILVLQTRIKERGLIVYVLESVLADEKDKWPDDYKTAIRDEIQNHQLVILEYKEYLNQLQK